MWNDLKKRNIQFNWSKKNQLRKEQFDRNINFKKPIFSYRLLDDKKNNTGTNLEKSINPSKYKIQTEE